MFAVSIERSVLGSDRHGHHDRGDEREQQGYEGAAGPRRHGTFLVYGGSTTVRLSAVGTVTRMQKPDKADHRQRQGRTAHPYSVRDHPTSGAMYALQGVSLGLMMPFLVPLLDERGLGAAEIGLILGIAGVASLLTYPVWGAIADGWLGRPRTIALTAITAALGGLGLLFAGSDPLTLALALSLAMAGLMRVVPLLDALTLGELDAAGSGYGRIRVWASAGWAAAATAGGVTWLVAGPARCSAPSSSWRCCWRC